MECSVPLPSLLVFGPHSELPSEEILQNLRRDLIGNPELSALKDALKDLPRFWDSIIELDPELRRIPAAGFLGDLRQWVISGKPLNDCQKKPPNLFTLPITLLLQINQYMCYLNHHEDISHQQLLKSVGASGIQGFCTGFLTAIIVASSVDTKGVVSVAANGLRLALCIGAYVDLDRTFSETPRETSCIAIRWTAGNVDQEASIANLIESYPEVRYHSNHQTEARHLLIILIGLYI